MRSRFWTKEDDETFIKAYPNSSVKALCQLFDRTPSAIRSRAIILNIRKPPVYVKARRGNIVLKYKDELVKNLSVECATDVGEAVRDWYVDMRPALQRGEKLILEIVHTR